MPSNIIAAHEDLEAVRSKLLLARESMNFDYYMDGITHYHHAMEPIAIAVKTAVTPEDLSDEIISTLAELLPELQATATALGARELNGEIYYFTHSTTSMIKELVQQSIANIEKLSSALEVQDKANILSSAKTVKPLFMKLFLPFGDFMTTFNQDMAMMEQAYIPPLFFTNSATVNEATLAMTQVKLVEFEETWHTFSGHYASIADFMGFTDSFDRINNNILDAKSVLDNVETTPVNLIEVHDILENVRVTLYELRTSLNYAWIMDQITVYHHDMEAIALMVKPISSATELSADIIAELAHLSMEIQNSLINMNAYVDNLDASVFNFSEEKMLSIQEAMLAIETNHANLESGLLSADSDVIYSAAKQVKPLFIAFFKLLGYF